MMENTKGFEDNSFFAGYLVSCHSSLLNSLPLGFGMDFVQMGQCSPHLHSSSAVFLFWSLLSIRALGIAACFGGVFSSVFSILIKGGCWDFISIEGIGHDALAMNKFIQAGMGFGHGVSYLFCGAVAVAAALGCCYSVGVLLFGAEGPSSSWDFLAG